MGICLAIEGKPGGPPGTRIRAVGAQDRAHQLVVGLILIECLVKKRPPRGRRDVQIGPALHPERVKYLLHPPSMEGAFQQAIDQPGPLVREGSSETLEPLRQAG